MSSRQNIGLEYTEGSSTSDIRMVYESTHALGKGLLVQVGRTTLNAYTTFIRRWPSSDVHGVDNTTLMMHISYNAEYI